VADAQTVVEGSLELEAFPCQFRRPAVLALAGNSKLRTLVVQDRLQRSRLVWLTASPSSQRAMVRAVSSDHEVYRSVGGAIVWVGLSLAGPAPTVETITPVWYLSIAGASACGCTVRPLMTRGYGRWAHAAEAVRWLGVPVSQAYSLIPISRRASRSYRG
jgi:hypothetical protein